MKSYNKESEDEIRVMVKHNKRNCRRPAIKKKEKLWLVVNNNKKTWRFIVTRKKWTLIMIIRKKKWEERIRVFVKIKKTT